jgi:hypothetical protein
MMAHPNLQDRAPSRSDRERVPRGPHRGEPASHRGVSPALVVASTSLLGTLLAMGAAAAAPAAASGASSAPCLGTLTASVPSVALLGVPTEVSLHFTPAPGVKASCASSLTYTYLGLPPGFPASHTSVVRGSALVAGTFPVTAEALGSSSVPMTAQFALVVR